MIKELLFLWLTLILTTRAEESSILDGAEIINPNEYFNWPERGEQRA